MNAATAKETALAWVNECAAKIPGFEGAFLTGSICELENTDQMSKFSDVDMILVWKIPPENMPKGKRMYADAILDVSHITFDDLGSHESILANYHRAYHFSRQNVLCDPTGRLSALQEKVAAEFSRPEWIRKRIKDAVRHDKIYLDKYLEWHESSIYPLPWRGAGIAAFAAGIMTHVILAAALKNPTVRNRYLAVRYVLSEHGEIGYYERLLEFLGCRFMNKEQVAAHLNSLNIAFDAAVQHISTPYMFGSDLSPAGRIIAIDGSQDLIDQGFHREAVFYMVATFSRCLHVLLVDAPRNLHDTHAAGLTGLLCDLGMGTTRERLHRIEMIRSELPRLENTAEKIAGL